MKASPRCIEKIKSYEAYREYAYPDPESDLARATPNLRKRWGFARAGLLMTTLTPEQQKLSGAPWTVGYGTTKGVTPESKMTEAEASARLVKEVADFEHGVETACTVPPNQNEFDAMVSLAYNIGLGWLGSVKPKGAKDGFRQSSVLKAHNRGDKLAASRAFGLWNKSNGKVSAGLTRRRAGEGAWYLEPDNTITKISMETHLPEVVDVPDEEKETLAMPQVVDAESKLTASPINKASVVAGGTAAVGAVAEMARTVADVKNSVSSLGDWLLPIALVMIVGLCGYIVYNRWNQRSQGWA